VLLDGVRDGRRDVVFQACAGLTKGKRSKEGRKGGEVKHIVLLRVLVCEAGESFSSLF
jgi:hypothetical protein